MSIKLDLVISFIITGLLTLMIFRIQAFMTETSLDNRLAQEMQGFADVTMTVIGEELRSLNDPLSLSEENFRFSNSSGDTVEIYRDLDKLRIIVSASSGSPPDSLTYPSRLSGLRFSYEPEGETDPVFLRVRVESENRPEQQIGGELKQRMRAVAEKRFFLRNLHLK